jgi:hypothetical protein
VNKFITFRAKHILTIILGGSSASEGLFSRVTFETSSLTTQRLEEVDRALSARSETSVRVESSSAHLSAEGGVICTGLEGKLLGRAGSALLETVAWGLTGVSVAGAFQARHQTGRTVSSISADRHAGSFSLRSHVLGPSARWAGLAASLSRFVLVGSLGTECAGFFSLSGVETGWAFETSGDFGASDLIENLADLTNESTLYVGAKSIERRADVSSGQLEKLFDQVLGGGDGEVKDEVVCLTAEVVDARLGQRRADHDCVDHVHGVFSSLDNLGDWLEDNLNIDTSGTRRATFSKELSDGLVVLLNIVEVLALALSSNDSGV